MKILFLAANPETTSRLNLEKEAREIQDALDNYEPRIEVDRIEVDIPPDSNELNVEVVYDIIGLSILPQKVNFILSPT